MRRGGVSIELRRLAEPTAFALHQVTTDSGGESFGTMRADGREFYFTRHSPNWSKHTIVRAASRDGARWSAPDTLSFSKAYSDREPFLSPDGLQLWFSSTRPPDGAGPAQRTRDLWVVDPTEVTAPWGAPRRIPEIVNTASNEYCPSITADGTLYFVSDRGGGLGGNDIYRAKWRNGQFEPPVNLGPAINSPAHETNVFVTPDEGLMLISADGRTDSDGGDDLYVSERQGDAWSLVRHRVADQLVRVRVRTVDLARWTAPVLYQSPSRYGYDLSRRRWGFVAQIASG